MASFCVNSFVANFLHNLTGFRTWLNKKASSDISKTIQKNGPKRNLKEPSLHCQLKWLLINIIINKNISLGKFIARPKGFIFSELRYKTGRYIMQTYLWVLFV